MVQPKDKEPNRVQISIRIPEATNNLFQAKVKLVGSDNTETLGRMIDAYVKGDPAAIAIAEGRPVKGASKNAARADGDFIKVPTYMREKMLWLVGLLSAPGEFDRFMDGLVTARAMLGKIEQQEKANEGPQIVPEQQPNKKGQK